MRIENTYIAAQQKAPEFSLFQGRHPDDIYGHLDPNSIFGWDENALRQWLKDNEEMQTRWIGLRGNRLIDDVEMIKISSGLEALSRQAGHKVPDGFFSAKGRDSSVYRVEYDITPQDGDGKGRVMKSAGDTPALSIEGYIREMKDKYAAHYAAYRNALLAYEISRKTPREAAGKPKAKLNSRRP